MAAKKHSGATPADDMKAKFREALAKKKDKSHGMVEGIEHDGSEKSHGADGPTQAPEFRRKSI